MSIGASIFVKNGIDLGYCYLESIESLLKFCDQVAVLDCLSTDGTTETLIELAKKEPRIKLKIHQAFDVAPDYTRLSILANMAKDLLDTDYHIMLQADEIIHPASIPYIIQASLEKKVCYVRRYNLWGSPNLYIPFDSKNKPCGDVVCRLAPIDKKAMGDAESLDNTGAVTDYLDKVTIIHYGFVRPNHLQKIKQMQEWFWNDPSKVDPKVLEQIEKDNIFDGSYWYKREDLKQIPFSHPIFMKSWLEKILKDKTQRMINL